MNQRIAILLCIVSILSGCSRGCSRKTPSADPVAAQVNDEPVPLSQFMVAYNRAKESLDSMSQSDPKAVERLKNTTLNRLIFQKLISQEASRRQIMITEDELNRSIEDIQKDIPKEQFQKNLTEQLMTIEDWKEMQRQKLLSEKVARVSLQVNTDVADDEIKSYYDKFKEDFFSEAKVRAQQIYVTDESLAEDLLKRLKAGGSFPDLAKKHSVSPDAQKGGDLGFFARDEMIPEFNIAFDLKKGVLHPQVIKSNYGFHILKTLEHQTPRQMSLSDAKETIRRKILEEREEKSYKKWLEELVARAKILKNDELVRAL